MATLSDPISESSHRNGPQRGDPPVLQGVLHKRRDVFRKRWRPRWFTLDQNSGILTYYLMSNSANSGANPDIGASHASQDSGVDYEVVPRGTIYLPGCRVAREDALSQNGWYVLSISPPLVDAGEQQQQSKVYLSTRSEVDLIRWIEKLTELCGHGLLEANIEESDASEETSSSSVHGDERQGDMNGSNTYPGTKWEDLEDTKTLLEGVPSDVADRIQNALRQNLRFTEEAYDASWSKTLEIPNGITVYQRKEPHVMMIKTVGILRHHPKQLLNLLLDLRRRRDFEPNVRETECLKRYNPHTCLEHFAFRAYWPTSARDFAVASHWRVLQSSQNISERAICYFGFSDPFADELRPTAPDHVRATLFTSMYVLKLLENGRCHLTRILSYDLGGRVPASLAKIVLQQQASMPVALTQVLQSQEPNPIDRLSSGELSNENVVQDVVSHLPGGEDGTLEESVKRQLKFEEDDEGAKDSTEPDRHDAEVSELSISVTAIVLLTPLVLLQFAHHASLPGKEIYFTIAVIFAVRAVTLSHLGRRVENDTVESKVGTVTCRLSVDLKGVLRFLANRKEEQEEEDIHSPEVSIVHIVMSAIAQAMEETEALRSQKVTIPLLGIGGYFLPPGGGVDMSLLTFYHEDPNKPENVTTLKGVKSRSVQEIVERLDREQNNGRQSISWMSSLMRFFLLRRNYLGSCVVVASPDVSDHAEVEVDVAPLLGSGVLVVVVVGGVRLVREVPVVSPVKKKRNSIAPPTKSMLQVSVTMNCPICSVQSLRLFAERLQRLVRFPEMCDE